MTDNGSVTVKGGPWFLNARYCRSAYRIRGLRGLSYNYWGFRIVLKESTND